MDESGPSMLAGDVGGTKTDLAILVRRAGRLSATRQAELASREYASLEELIRRFLASDSGPWPEAACLAIAGPVEAGAVRTTNLPWRVEAAALGRAIGIGRVQLVNDLQAAAYGMLFLEDADFEVLHAVAPRREGTVAILPLKEVPVRVALNPRAALIGAAHMMAGPDRETSAVPWR